jgi:hypothetical protein
MVPEAQSLKKKVNTKILKSAKQTPIEAYYVPQTQSFIRYLKTQNKTGDIQRGELYSEKTKTNLEVTFELL